jgi:hypothetical protein
MKDIYNINNINDLYNIIKGHYNLEIKDFKIKKESISIFDKFKEKITNKNDYLNYEFASKYLQKCNNCFHITYKYGEINMFISLRGNLTKQMKMQLYKNLYRVYLLTKIYNISTAGSSIFNYYIIMNPQKRFLPTKKEELIDVENINGGFTYINKNDIFIIRKEDYNKVIIHELLHHNKFIHKTDWKDDNIKRLKTHFNISASMLLIPNEAIIETYACILNTIFFSIETGTSLKENLKKDQKHSIALAKKILDKQNGEKWVEKTHSFCYIVFKTILYVYFNKFLKIYKYHNDTEITDFLIKHYAQIRKKTHLVAKQGNNKLKQTIY